MPLSRLTGTLYKLSHLETTGSMVLPDSLALSGVPSPEWGPGTWNEEVKALGAAASENQNGGTWDTPRA
jgi:hypothetical protein